MPAIPVLSRRFEGTTQGVYLRGEQIALDGHCIPIRSSLKRGFHLGFQPLDVPGQHLRYARDMILGLHRVGGRDVSRFILGAVPQYVPGLERIVGDADPDLVVVAGSASPPLPLHQRAGALPLDPEALSQLVVGEPRHRIQGSAPSCRRDLALVRYRLVCRVGSGVCTGSCPGSCPGTVNDP